MNFLWLGLAGSLISTAILSYSTISATQLELREKKIFNATEYLSMRRHYFNGHREFSDLLDSLNVLATTIEVMSAKHRKQESPYLDAKFEDAIKTVNFLSQFKIGMNEIYLFPAQYLFFDLEDPAAALPIIEYGISDTATDGRVPLLGAFIAHLFLRDQQKAVAYYDVLSTKYKTPAWVKELADKIRSGNDPVEKDPKIRQRIYKMMLNAFPKAEPYLEKHWNREEAKIR